MSNSKMWTTLTEAMEIALRRALSDGMVVACRRYVTRAARVERGTPASVLRALQRRGLVTLHIHQDGNMSARLTDAGRVHVYGCAECARASGAR